MFHIVIYLILQHLFSQDPVLPGYEDSLTGSAEEPPPAYSDIWEEQNTNPRNWLVNDLEGCTNLAEC